MAAMAENGKLELELVDVNGKFLGEKVDVTLRHQTLSDSKKASSNASQKFTITNLHSAPQGLYRMEIDPPSFLPVNQFINIKPSGATNLRVVFPIDPKKVKSVDFAKYKNLSADAQKLLSNSDQVLSYEGKMGNVLYDALDNVRRAGLLNILAKTEATPLSNGQTVLPYIQELRELRGDRFFVIVSKELREETKHSVSEELFHPVSGSLHHLPAQFMGFKPAREFQDRRPLRQSSTDVFHEGRRVRCRHRH
ncbi:MAG: hypothetical protein WKF84_15790 [Pyrinomonadaceae bacterium]